MCVNIFLMLKLLFCIFDIFDHLVLYFWLSVNFFFPVTFWNIFIDFLVFKTIYANCMYLLSKIYNVFIHLFKTFILFLFLNLIKKIQNWLNCSLWLRFTFKLLLYSTFLPFTIILLEIWNAFYCAFSVFKLYRMYF